MTDSIHVALRPPRPAEAWVELDTSQRRALDRVAAGESLLVTGAPGTGKTTVALAAISGGLAHLAPERVLLVTADRRAAALLRDRLSTCEVTTSGGPMVRTMASLAYSILRREQVAAGQPAPTLITGPEQDTILAELLAGHERGLGQPIAWPPEVPPASRQLAAFRAELRDLLMRAAEYGLEPAALADVGHRAGRADWVAAAQVYQEYLDVVTLRSVAGEIGVRYDPASIVAQAALAMPAFDDDVRPTWDLVVVDDFQEVTLAGLRLLTELRRGGAQMVLTVNPDEAVQGYRGADPHLAGTVLARRDLVTGTAALAAGWRGGQQLGALAADLAGRIRTVGVPVDYRRAMPAGCEPTSAALDSAPAGVDDASGGAQPAVVTAVLGSTAAEFGYIAQWLRRAHLLDEVPWDELAVIVRAGASVEQARSALALAGVPVRLRGAERSLREEGAVRPLLIALRYAVAGELDGEQMAELLTSAIGGMDSMSLRAARRALVAEERASGGNRDADQLLAAVGTGADSAHPLPPAIAGPLTRMAQILAVGRAGASQPGVDARTVLWQVWSACAVADAWRAQALAGGPGGARADQDLDAVLALFEAAERFAERMPGATAVAFADYVESQDLPADSLAARAADQGAVTICTAAASAGLQWRRVAVAGVQDGQWPDLRLRNSMLGAGDLVELLSGRGAGATEDLAEARRAVLDDEIRSFLVAVTRAREQVVVTAVADADERPSALYSLAERHTGLLREEGETWPLQAAPMPMDLRGLVARIRAELLRECAREDGASPASSLNLSGQGGAGGDLAEVASGELSSDARQGAALLAFLARMNVQGAHPREWFGLAGPSTTSPLAGTDGTLRLSVSQVEKADLCPLRWALETSGGRRPPTPRQGVGTLVHSLAERFPAGTEADLLVELETAWPGLHLPDNWTTRREYQTATEMVERLARYNAAHPGEHHVEEPVRATIDGVALRGRADRLEDAGDGVRVVDFKTGTTIVSKPDAELNPQLGCYQEMINAGGWRPGARAVGAQLVYLRKGAHGPTIRPQASLAAAADPTWVKNLIGSLRERLAGPDLAATANAGCEHCPVRRSCPLQVEGGEIL